MMNRKKYLNTITTVLLLFVLGACSEDRSLFPSEVSVVFTSGIQGHDVSTRASNNLWSANDRVGIYMTSPDDNNLANAYKKNIEYKAASGGTSTSLVAVGSSIEFPGEERVKFVAYYPYKSTLSNYIYPVDVTTQALFSNIDLLYHSSTTTYERTSPNVSLGFTHQLSKFTVSVIPGTGVTIDLSGTTASLSGFPLRGSFNLSDGTLSSLNTFTAFTPVKNPSTAVRASFECILVPHLGTAGYTRTITLTIGAQNYSYTLPVTRNFDPGKAYNYEFTFTGSQIVLAQNSITEWGGGTIAWGDNLLSSDKTFLDLPAAVSNGSVKISTTATADATFELSTAADRITPEKPGWITGVTLPKGTVSEGWTPYTLNFNTIETKFITPRTGYIHLKVSGLTVVVRVTKAAVPLFVSKPNIATFSVDGAARSQAFTYTTNSESAAPTLTYSLNGTSTGALPDWLKTVTPSRVVNNATGVSTFTTTFSTQENLSTTTSRTRYIHYSHNGIEEKVQINQGKNIANCYVVAPGSAVLQIPVDRAISEGGMSPTATFTGVKLWDDGNVVSAVSTSGTGATGYINVTIHASNRGNALVALRVGTVIYWSWHIWVTPYNPYTAPAWDYNGYTFMDRHMGALNNQFDDASCGVYYQWGRKDPMPRTDLSGFSTVPAPITLKTSIQNPNKMYIGQRSWLVEAESHSNLWGKTGSKTVYDPCPISWRVPVSRNGLSPWNGVTPTNFAWKGTGVNVGRQYGTVATAMYPAAGYRDAGSGGYGDRGGRALIWQADDLDHYFLTYFFGFTSGNDINYVWGADKSHAMSVRCVRE